VLDNIASHPTSGIIFIIHNRNTDKSILFKYTQWPKACAQACGNATRPSFEPPSLDPLQMRGPRGSLRSYKNWLLSHGRKSQKQPIWSRMVLVRPSES